MNNTVENLQKLLETGIVDEDLNSLSLPSKLIVGESEIGDTDIILAQDASGLIVHVSKVIEGYHPGQRFDLVPTLVVEEKKIPVYQSIEIREHLKTIIAELEVLITISGNKHHTSDTTSALKKLQSDTRVRLEKLEDKLRELTV